MTCTIGFEPVLATLSAWHIALIMAVVLLMFGGKKLPELARGLAKGIRIFRDELHGTASDIEDAIQNPPPPASPAKQEQPPQTPEKKA